MYPELAGDQHPSAQTDHRQGKQRPRRSDPSDFAPDARIIPRVRFGVDPEDSMKSHPNCLSSSAVVAVDWTCHRIVSDGAMMSRSPYTRAADPDSRRRHPGRRSRAHGIRPPDTTGVLYLVDPLEGFGLSAEDSAALHAIMSVGSRERLEFLG